MSKILDWATLILTGILIVASTIALKRGDTAGAYLGYALAAAVTVSMIKDAIKGKFLK